MNIYKEQEEDEEELECTGEVSADDLELVSLVKVNPGLWNNSLKIYSNANDKNLAWSVLGQSLATPLSGSEVQKKFINWRSTFGRLHKKVLRSQPKSGSSNDQLIYMPTWPLYNELLFLKDVIKPRVTKSNFVKLACVPSNKPTSTSRLKKFQSPLMEDTIIQELSNDATNTTLQLKELATSVEDSSTFFIDSQYIESPHNSFYDSQTDVSDAGSFVSKSEDSQPKKKIKVKTPPSDHFYNKKKIKDDEDLKTLKDMADSVRTMTATLTTSTSKFGTSQNSCDRLSETLNPEIEAFIQILKSSLGRIPPTSRLTCLIELLPIIQKYEQV